MKKEVLIAIIIGIILGFGTTAVFWARQEGKLTLNLDLPFQNKSTDESKINEKKQQESNSVEEIAQNEPEVQGESSIKLEIDQPVNESVSKLSRITLSGITEPNAIVAIIMADEEQTIIADEAGKFETEIDLEGGENIISISAFDDDGNSSTKEIIVIHSTSSF